VVLLDELRHAIGEQHNRDQHVARLVHRFTRLIINPFLAPMIESVGTAGCRLHTNVDSPTAQILTVKQ